MSLKKRITASITAAALTAASVLTLSGCSQSVSRAMTVNGEDIPAGILAGKRAGMAVCAVDDPFSRHMASIITIRPWTEYLLRTMSKEKQKITVNATLR